MVNSLCLRLEKINIKYQWYLILIFSNLNSCAIKIHELRLENLGLRSLELGRNRANLIKVFEIHIGLIKIPIVKCFLNPHMLKVILVTFVLKRG